MPSRGSKEGRFQETSVQRQSATTLQCCHQVVGLGKQCPFWYDHSGFEGGDELSHNQQDMGSNPARYGFLYNCLVVLYNGYMSFKQAKACFPP